MKKYTFVKSNDLSIARAETIDYCINMAKHFLEHFHKIFMSPNDQNVNHWISEMSNWYKDVSSLVLSYNKKLISNKELENWFFTKGSLPKYLFTNEEEAKCYTQFYKELLRIKDVKQSLINICLIKEKGD